MRKRRSKKKTATRPDPTFVSDQALQGADGLEVVIIRSARRKKTVGAKLLNWYTLEIRAPVDIADDELADIIQRLKERMLTQRNKWRNFSSDDDLQQRAQKLNLAHFKGELRWRSIRFVTNQNSRFGSCTPARGSIRISHRLAGVPTFVLDYVIVHEMAHLIEPNHSQAFWDLVYRYPRTERARGYLMAMGMEDDIVDPESV